MRKSVLIFCFLLIVTSLFSQKISTYYFIRHAEKQMVNNQNPELTEAGILRAENWANIFKDIKFDAVYSTDYLRTKATAQPTAISQSLEIILYHPSKIDIDNFLKETEGKTVLIVGHSNTIPGFVNNLIGINKYANIEDDNFGNLYIVEFGEGIKTDKLLHLK